MAGSWHSLLAQAHGSGPKCPVADGVHDSYKDKTTFSIFDEWHKMSRATAHATDYHGQLPERDAPLPVQRGREHNTLEASQDRRPSLTEVSAPDPVQRRDEEAGWHRQTYLEDESSDSAPSPPAFSARRPSPTSSSSSPPSRSFLISNTLTHFYILSYLVFFSIWGTLARLGISLSLCRRV